MSDDVPRVGPDFAGFARLLRTFAKHLVSCAEELEREDTPAPEQPSAQPEEMQ